jgi:glyoxylase I family protein
MRWSHVALSCRDIAVTEEFYTRWFSFSRSAEFVLGEGNRIVFLRRGDAYLELFTAGDGCPAPDGPTSPGLVRHIALQTTDIDAQIKHMGQAAQLSLGPLSFDQFIEGWRSAWITDPDGTIVEISQGYRDLEEQQ